MAFRTKANVTDHFELVDASGDPATLEIKSGNSNVEPGVVAEAEDEIGDVFKTDTNGSKEKLTNEFLIKGALALATTAVLGTLSDAKAILLGITITTSKGKAPEMSAEGARMNATAAQGSTITLPSISVSPLHKAQILGSAFTFTGEGCKLNECTFKASCNNSLGEVAGEIVSNDIQRGMMEVTANIISGGAVDPTITPGTGWTITSGPSKGEPEGGHDTWNVTLTKPLTTTPAT